MSTTPNSTDTPLDYIGRLEARLEIDKIFMACLGDESILVERVLTLSERRQALDSRFDGIGCRDETIWLQSEKLRKVFERQSEMFEELKVLVKRGAFTEQGSAAHGMAIGLSEILKKYAKEQSIDAV